MDSPIKDSADRSGTAPILSRNIPEPTSYTGKYYVKLPFREEEYFSLTKKELPDHALRFDGRDDYIEIPHDPRLAITGDLTICAWIKADDLSGSLNIFSKTKQNIPAPYDLYTLPPDGRITFMLGNGTKYKWAETPRDATITPGRWQHIAVTLLGSTVTIFINGEAKAEGNIKGDKEDEGAAQLLGDAGTPLRIGMRADSAGPMKGLIDQVQLWNRALSQEEVRRFKDFVSMYEDGLVGCWLMNEGLGSQIRDSSPNQLHGEIKSGTTWVLSDRSVTQAPQLRVDADTLGMAFDDAVQKGIFHPGVFPNLGWITTEADRAAAIQVLKNADGTAVLDKADFKKRYRAGERLRIQKSSTGMVYDFVHDPSREESSMFLIETYRLSSFLGAYGVGRTLKTFSLLPGEKTTISISTYKRSKESASSASSIFDSFSNESAQDFSSEMASERSDTSKSDESLAWHAEAEVEASWGWGSAKVSGGASGSSNSSRESFAKSVSNVTGKHAAKASAKRDVQINTSSEVETESGEQTAIQRAIENINVSRTLNFIFRQMNQEYITLLHLVDVKIGFGISGIPQSRRIVPLPELDGLLEEVIINDEKKRREVKDFIIGELENIRDYQDKTVKEHQAANPDYPDFVQRVSLNDGENREVAAYHRLRKDFTSTYVDAVTGTGIEVPGIILNADKVVMRTDDVLVDALLGEGEALDSYSKGLQREAVEVERAQNEFLVLKNELLKRIVNAPDHKTAGEALELYQKIFGLAAAMENGAAAPLPKNGQTSVTAG